MVGSGWKPSSLVGKSEEEQLLPLLLAHLLLEHRPDSVLVQAAGVGSERIDVHLGHAVEQQDDVLGAELVKGSGGHDVPDAEAQLLERLVDVPEHAQARKRFRLARRENSP